MELTNALFVLIDEVFALSAREGPKTLILQSRQKNASLELDLEFARLSPDVAIKPPPTFPFLESQCQRANSDVNFHHAREATPPARQCPAGGVGAVYRRVLLPCQTGNRAVFAFFTRVAEPIAATLQPVFSAFNLYGGEVKILNRLK